MGYSGAGGKLIHEKNQNQIIPWHWSFKVIFIGFVYVHKFQCVPDLRLLQGVKSSIMKTRWTGAASPLHSPYLSSPPSCLLETLQQRLFNYIDDNA